MMQGLKNGNTTYRYLLVEQLKIIWKNEAYVFNNTIAFIAGIDLSGKWQLPFTTDPKRAHITWLESLELSQNQFSGEIPPSLGVFFGGTDQGKIEFIQSSTISPTTQEGQSSNTLHSRLPNCTRL
jgi:hypothetical protein